MRLVDVALPIPLFRSFSYLVPDGFGDRVCPGARVLVPVRGARAIGIVLGESTGEPPANAKAIIEVPDAKPVFDAPLLATGNWIARHYHAPIGLTLRAMLPAPLTGRRAPDSAYEDGTRADARATSFPR